MPLLPEKKIYHIDYNNSILDSSLLSIPIITKINGILKCNYNKISLQKGPYCPEFYSKPIILNIISFVDEEIKAEICKLPSKENNDSYDNLSLINSDKQVNNIEILNIDKYIKVKKYIQPKETIQIEINIPNSLEKGKRENHQIMGLLKLVAGQANYEIIIDAKILIIPMELLLSCKNYKLEYKNGNFYLKTNELYSEEILIFEIQNHFEGENILIKTKIDYFDKNNAKEPKINIENEKIIVNIPEDNNMEARRLNCKIEFYITSNYKISIIIDSVLIPNYSFKVYDYLNKCFTSKKWILLYLF